MEAAEIFPPSSSRAEVTRERRGEEGKGQFARLLWTDGEML